MELATFAIDDGFAEAILRGLRSSFLTENNYNQMKQCGSLAELKTFLEETDYSSVIQGGDAELPIPILRQKLKAKLAGEFEYIECQTVQPLSEFLHLIKCKYMIDNVVNMIEGIKNRVDPDVLEAGADPLGYFKDMNRVRVIDGDDYAGLYKEVLIDTPIGPYFMKFLESMLPNAQESKNLSTVSSVFKDLRPEFVRTTLKKMWLEDFYDFCDNNLSGSSRSLMIELLNFEADCKTIQVVYNTIAYQQDKLVEARKNQIPIFGNLYPECYKGITESTTFEALKENVKGIDNYRQMLHQAPDPSKKEDFNFAAKTLDDIMFEEETKRYSLAYDQASQYAVFYAYLKLKEQEIRNIIWLAEMITRKLDRKHPGFKKIIIPFQAQLQGRQ